MNMSEFIHQDLRDRIGRGSNIPSDLTLAGLAEHYEVSLMPVRLAVDALIEDRLLTKKSNGRLEVNPKRVGKRKQQASTRRPSDWYTIISEEVVHQSLQQIPENLTIDGTANKHNIGRSVAQNILIRLAGEGLIEHTPRKSWSIRPFRQKDLDDYLDVRSLLELHALDLAKNNLDADDLQAMLEQNKTATHTEPAKLDNRLHKYWIDRSDNRYIQDFFYRHTPFFTLLYNYSVDHEPKLISGVAKQHQLILTAMIRKRWRVARQELAHDIESLRPILLDAISRISSSTQRSSAS
jgi:DNA-binding GntR family transcriptional regulator